MGKINWHEKLIRDDVILLYLFITIQILRTPIMLGYVSDDVRNFLFDCNLGDVDCDNIARWLSFFFTDGKPGPVFDAITDYVSDFDLYVFESGFDYVLNIGCPVGVISIGDTGSRCLVLPVAAHVCLVLGNGLSRWQYNRVSDDVVRSLNQCFYDSGGALLCARKFDDSLVLKS